MTYAPCHAPARLSGASASSLGARREALLAEEARDVLAVPLWVLELWHVRDAVRVLDGGVRHDRREVLHAQEERGVVGAREKEGGLFDRRPVAPVSMVRVRMKGEG